MALLEPHPIDASLTSSEYMLLFRIAEHIYGGGRNDDGDDDADDGGRNDGGRNDDDVDGDGDGDGDGGGGGNADDDDLRHCCTTCHLERRGFVQDVIAVTGTGEKGRGLGPNAARA